MGFGFDRADGTLQDSLRRIAGEELGSALTRLVQVDQPEAVHAIRKNLKKTRALLRLVRSGLAVQRDENAALRAIAMALATRRDATARLITFDSLFADPPDSLRPLRQHLAGVSQTPADALPEGLREALKTVRKRAAKWTLHGKDHAILRHGLADTRLRAVRASKAARKDPESEILIHDWRKRVKDHWYQARLFAPCWPDLFKPVVDSADRLGEALGAHHDLSLFADLVAALPPDLTPEPARKMLNTAINDARTRITGTAFPASALLFAGEPDAMADLWLDWRRVWGQDG